MNSSNPNPSTGNVQSARSNIWINFALFFSVLAVPQPALTQVTIAPCYKTVAEAEAAAIAATTSTNNCGGGQTLISVNPVANGLIRTDLGTFTETGTNTITLAGYTVTGGQGIARNPVNGQYYAILKVSSGTRRLVTIDVHTGVATDMGSLGDQFSSITFAPDGRLFGVTGDGAAVPETLYQIDPRTAAKTFLRALGNGTDGEVICFNPDDNHIYHWSGNSERIYFEKIESDPPYNITIITIKDDIEVFGAVYRGGGVFLIGDSGSHYQTCTTAGAAVIVTNSPSGTVRRGYALEGGGELVKTAATVGDCDAVVTVTVTDGCGNTALVPYNTRIDNTPPSITCPAPVAVSCPGDVPAHDFAGGTSSDNCPGGVTVTWEGDVISGQTCANRYTITRTYKATDVCGNLQTCAQTITVDDETVPSITCPAPVTVSCPGDVPAHDFAGGTSSDNCPGGVTVTWEGDVISGQTCANRYTITRTYKATDVCGNFQTCAQTITVDDETVPSITCPAPVTVSCPGDVPAHDFAGGTSSDNCPGGVTVTWEGDVISGQTCANRYTITRTYRATDVCGNFQTCAQTITVDDETVPSITCPAPVTVSCPGDVPAHDFAGGTSSDNCPGGVTVTWEGDVISGQTCANRYTITRTYKATDVCGNFQTCAQTITVDDETVPSITCPAPVTVSCPGDVPAHDFAGGTSSDNCPGGVTVTWEGDVISGQTCANRYTITRTYKATDVCGNFQTCAQTITVDDETVPSITCPAPVTVSCPGDVPAHDFAGGTSSDNCPGGVTVTWEGDVISGQTCANRYTITRTYKATDVCGNFQTCAQTITVDDETVPSITCPAPVTVSCPGDVPAHDFTGGTSSDNCPGGVTVTWEGDVISGQTCANRYTITRTYKATDVCGNFQTCAQTITVDDETVPSITCPAPVTVSCPGDVPAHDFAGGTSSDNCSGDVTVTWEGDVISGQTCANRYTITRTYRATDACGNSATCSQTITVNDTTLPTISCPGPVTVQRAADVPAPNPSLVTASDTCAGTVTVTHVGDMMSLSNCVNQFTLTRTYRATDVCGNSATCSQTITVNGTTLPTISCPGPMTVQCAADVPAPNPSLVTASDTCAGAVVVTHVSDMLSLSNCVNQFTITRTYRATDARGNSATCAQTITVNDTTPPAITCPDDIVISTGGACAAVDLTDLGTPVVSDNCSAVTVSTNRLDGKSLADPYPIGTTTIQWTATDACGNSSICNQKVTVTTEKFIASDFNGTAIPGGSTVWFNSNAKVKLNGHCPAKILFSQQTIKSAKFNLAIPDSEINFVAGACPATTIFDGVKWVTTVGCDLTKPVFLSGYAFQVPAAGLPGGIKPVTWSGTLTTDTPGVSLKWSWGAAVYTMFAPDNNSIGVKPVDGNQCTSYFNSDHSGTPENYKPYLIGGARGGGGSNWTGGLSGTQAVAPCGP